MFGKMHGKGEYVFPNGNSYKGEFKNDKRDGYGIYKWQNMYYEGDWENGK